MTQNTTVDPSQLKELLAIMRSMNEDEFTPSLTKDETYDDLKKEILYYVQKTQENKERKIQLIKHITECCQGDFFNQFSISSFEDELDVIGMGFNTYMEELQEKTISRDYFFHVFNAIPQIAVVFNLEGEIDLINQQAKDYFCCPKVAMENTIAELLPPLLIKEVAEFIANKEDKTEKELQVLLRNKKKCYIHYTLISIDAVKKDHLLLVASDITNKKKESNRILKATLYGQDKERKRLSYELHDSLGQEVNAIKMYLNAIGLMDYGSEEYLRSMKDVHSMLNDTIQSIKDITFDLLPTLLEKNNLTTLVQQLINRLNLICTFPVQFSSPPEGIQITDKKEELFIYRIIQEFLNNSIKYSKAKKIVVRLSQNSKTGKKTILLSDNGVGFEIKAIHLNNGVNNIINRLKTLDSEYVYTSEPNKGTYLKFSIYEKRKNT